MIRITVTSQTADFRTLQDLPPQLQKALGLARRDAIKKLSGYTAKLTAEQNYITQSEVKKATRIEPTGLRVRSGMRALDKYKVSPKAPRKRGYTLMGAVKRGALKPLGANAFLKRSGGKWRPYVRLTPNRKPYKLMYGPSIAQLVGSENNLPLIEERAHELFTNRAKYWTDRLTGGRRK